MEKISTCLWFDNQAEEAAKFYVSVFKDSKIGEISHYTEAGQETHGKKPGSIMTVSFQIEGREFLGLNGGPQFKFNESVSFVITCQDQAEIDYYWSKLSAVPESEICGWCKDKFGISWQIVPKNITKLVRTPAAMEAMMKMNKIVISELEDAQ